MGGRQGLLTSEMGAVLDLSQAVSFISGLQEEISAELLLNLFKGQKQANKKPSAPAKQDTVGPVFVSLLFPQGVSLSQPESEMKPG